MEVFKVLMRPVGGPEFGHPSSTDGNTPQMTTGHADAPGDKATNSAMLTYSQDNAIPLVSSTTSSESGSATMADISSVSASSTDSTSALSTATSLATDVSDHSSGGGGTSTKTKLAIAIPVAIVGAIIIIVIIFFIMRRRRRRQTPPTPTYEVAKNEDTLFSTSQLMAPAPAPVQQQKPAQASGGMPRFPMLDVPDSRDGDISPGSSGQMSQNESSHTEMGFGMAVSRDYRPDTTEQDLRHISRSASPANAVGSQIPDGNEHTRARDDDDVSVVSDYHGQRGHEHDYDDLSSVSSFDGDTPRTDDHQHPFR